MAWLTRRLAAAALVFMTANAAADGLDGERFVPAVGAEGGFTAEHPKVPYHLGWSLGLFLNFADDPVVEKTPGGTDVNKVVDTAVTTDLVASIGLLRRFEVGLHLPVHLVYSGDPYAAGGTTLDAGGGVGDLRLVPKVEILNSGDLEQHFLLGFAMPVAFPTGNEEEVRGSGGIAVHPKLLFAAHLGRIGLGFDVGYKWRTEHPATLPFGDEITLTPWATFRVADPVWIRAELISAKQVATDVDGADFPTELLGGVEYNTGSLALYGGATIGLTDGIGDPDFRIIAGVRYRSGHPQDQGYRDTDGDGVLDKDDLAPTEPEDKDGFKDDDGEPEPDNDHDGILDGDDECPELAGEADRRGCPSKTYVKIENGQIIIIGKVQFRSGSSEIDKNSEQLLDQIAQALEGNSQVKKLRIEGHTDNVGDDDMNLKLSESRAKSVKEALVKRGVDDDRLETKGVGEARPIAPNDSPGGRQKNRRVEFVIVGGGK
jgi:outer membrane protein OmpA-like peptidoglycan-associated protein